MLKTNQKKITFNIEFIYDTYYSIIFSLTREYVPGVMTVFGAYIFDHKIFASLQSLKLLLLNRHHLLYLQLLYWERPQSP